MRQFLTRVASILVAVFLALLPVAALAHPLGNFTINRYAGLLLRPDSIVVDYVIDMAEIPTYQELTQIDPNARTGLNDTQAATYRASKCAEFPANINLLLNDRALSLNLTDTALEFPPGAGGLPTLRLTCTYRATLGNLAAPNTVAFNDANYADRIGWREIVVQGDGVALHDSTAPTTSISQRLRNYPTDFLNSPLHQLDAHVSFDPIAAPSSDSALTQTNGVTVRQQDPLASLILTNDLSLPVLVLSFLLAIGLGAIHAVSPGHGKTVMAAYLVGTRGTIGQAMLLGLTVTVTHTIGVLILGVITLFASRYIVPESLYPWLSLISGVLVIVMGASLAYNRWRARQHEQLHHRDHVHPHTYIHDESHPHSHDHDEDHHHGHAIENDLLAHGHSHLTPEIMEQGLTLPNLIGLGLVGGLVPSTSALIILLAAISLQRIPLGIVLIIAFGLGMAMVLVGVGVLLVRASHWIERWQTPARLLPVMPLVSAIVVIGAGIVVSVEALLQMGVRL